MNLIHINSFNNFIINLIIIFKLFNPHLTHFKFILK